MRKAIAARLPGVRRAATGEHERWSEWIGRDFRRLLGAQFAAQAADGASQAVIANILVLEPLGQGTSGRVLEVSVLTLLPYSLIAPFLGVFVDRWARRSILIATSALRVFLLGAAIAAPRRNTRRALVAIRMLRRAQRSTNTPRKGAINEYGRSVRTLTSSTRPEVPCPSGSSTRMLAMTACEAPSAAWAANWEPRSRRKSRPIHSDHRSCSPVAARLAPGRRAAIAFLI